MLHISIEQRCTNLGRQVAVATEFCTVVPNILGFSVWNLLHVTVNFQVATTFLKNFCSPAVAIHPTRTSNNKQLLRVYFMALFSNKVTSVTYICNVQSKGKVQAVTCHERQRGGVQVLLLSFFNVGARWGWGQRHAPTALPARKRHGIHCTGGWVDNRAGLDG